MPKQMQKHADDDKEKRKREGKMYIMILNGIVEKFDVHNDDEEEEEEDEEDER